MMSYPCCVCFRLFIVGCSHLHSFNFSMNMPVFLADDRKNFEPMRGPLFLPKARPHIVKRHTVLVTLSLKVSLDTL